MKQFYSLSVFAVIFWVSALPLASAGPPATNAPAKSGNPIFPGWYADPEGAVFGDRFWVYPIYSAPFGRILEQPKETAKAIGTI